MLLSMCRNGTRKARRSCLAAMRIIARWPSLQVDCITIGMQKLTSDCNVLLFHLRRMHIQAHTQYCGQARRSSGAHLSMNALHALQEDDPVPARLQRRSRCQQRHTTGQSYLRQSWCLAWHPALSPADRGTPYFGVPNLHAAGILEFRACELRVGRHSRVT